MPSPTFVMTAFLFLLPFSVAAFTFNFTAPTQCDDMGLTWTGGTPPFKLLIIPVFGTPRDIAIPSSAFNNGKGSLPLQVPFKKDDQFVLTMSDSTGFNSGGTSAVMAVGQSKGGSSCNTTEPSIGFKFELNTALTQCRPFTFSGYETAIQPVTIGVVIPGGSGFLLNPPSGSVSFDWNANVARGTSMMFYMTDAQGRQGGSSDVRIVGFSDDNTCLNNQSPSSTTHPPGPAGTGTSTSPASSSSQPAQGTISAGGIAGAIIGSVLFLAVIITLAMFFLKQRRGGNNPGPGHSPHRQRLDSEVDLSHNGSVAPPFGMLPPGQGPASPYPSSPNPASPFESPYLDNPGSIRPAPYPASSRYQPSEASISGQYPTPFGAAQYQTSSRYQPSESSMSGLHPNSSSAGLHHSQQPSETSVSGQYESSLPYHRSNPSYPPHPNQHPQTAPSVDPFSSFGPPMVPDFDPYAGRSQGSTAQPSAPSASKPQSAAERKAAMAGVSSYTPSRFILHTDADDVLPPPNEDGVIELPPQYTERRGGPVRLDPPTDTHPLAQYPP